ncbi:MAG: hypothetical protein RLZZ214_2914 [Verrucomicrobiota bacterium]
MRTPRSKHSVISSPASSRKSETGSASLPTRREKVDKKDVADAAGLWRSFHQRVVRPAVRWDSPRKRLHQLHGFRKIPADLQRERGGGHGFLFLAESRVDGGAGVRNR